MITLPRLARDEPRASLLHEAAWHAVAITLLLLGPTQLWLRGSFWQLAPKDLPQVLAVAVGYLAFVFVLRIAVDRVRGIGLLAALAWGVACFAAAAVPLALRSDVPFSRGLFVASAVLGTGLALLPYFVTRHRGAVVSGLLVAILAVCVLGAQERHSANSHRRIRGALYVNDVSYFQGLVPKPGKNRGGGIVAYGKGFLLVDGLGGFYRLWWNPKGDSLQSRRLGITVPNARSQMLADFPDSNSVPRLRAADLIIDSLSSPMRVIVSHLYWNHDGRCITIRVSSTDLDSAVLAGSSHNTWRTLYETQPCVEPIGSFDDVEVGGRLAWMPDRSLLLSTGDLGFNGITSPALSQSLDNDYGKILQLDGKGGREIFSIGHRNPQGLVVARNGKIWETEHGPQGGDEINLVVKGGNYGWPYATYGTQYGLDYWPLAPNGRDHGKFTEPAHVFVPSVGVSSMIEMTDRQFPRSSGDLLVLSLGGQQMFRARIVGDRIIYVKPTVLDRRLRDATEGSDGRILMWTDEGDIIVLARAQWELTGNEVYATCASCHEPSMGATQSAAPTLHGIIGRRVASVPGYEYTGGLKAIGGVWTKERLTQFLAHPAAVAHGTLMAPWAVTDERQRTAIVNYLADLK